jgi:hypothetical protein
MIDAVVNNAEIKTLDELARQGKINLTRLTKEHAPLLVGVESNVLLSLVDRKLRPPQTRRKNFEKTPEKKAPVPKEMVLVNLPPKELADLT